MSVVLELDRMSLKEKLRTMEALWDDLCRTEEAIPVPQWHRELLDERAGLVRQGKARFISWEAAKKRIAARTSSRTLRCSTRQLRT